MKKVVLLMQYNLMASLTESFGCGKTTDTRSDDRYLHATSE